MKLWERLEREFNYNTMVSQRGVIDLYHSDAQRDAFARRGIDAKGAAIMIACDGLIDLQERLMPDRTTASACLERNGIEIVTAEMRVFEWLERSDQPEVHGALALIR